MRLIPKRLATAAILGLAVSVLGSALGTPAQAADAASIDHIQQANGTLQILLTLPKDAQPDLTTVKVTLGDKPVDATAALASDASAIARTTILAIDVSSSMEGARFEAAKQAAHLFLSSAPAGLRVGVVSFGASVTRVVEPTTDLASVGTAIDSLTLSKATRLFEGLSEAVTMAGTDGARSILLLSDGADNSKSPIQTAMTALSGSGDDNSRVKLDVVALEPDAEALQQLTSLVGTTSGTLLQAATPDAIAALFQSEADALRSQVVVTATPTAAQLGTSGNLSVSLDAGGITLSDGAFISIDKPVDPNAGQQLAEPKSGVAVSKSLMWIGLGAAAFGLLIILAFALGGVGGQKQDSIDKTIEAYTRQGAKKLAEARRAPQESVTQQAVGAAARLLERNKGFEATLGQRLEASGMAFKPAEWLLIHAGVAIVCGFVGFAIGGGNIIFVLVLLLVGVAGPWAFLGFKRARRLKAFNAQMADTLQLMAGSLSAGLSLAQSVDTVVREGSEPIANEFRRALIETRLGVSIEDALQGIAERMESRDFEWIVMAIRIQREVGGNLAELLNKVAETIREREYLERQVQSLSAEGRMSVWILGALPPGFLAYLMLANRAYLHPLISTTIGVAMLVLMGIMEVAGVLWMKKVVKVQV